MGFSRGVDHLKCPNAGYRQTSCNHPDAKAVFVFRQPKFKMKNKMQHLLVLAAAAAMVGLFTNNAAAQDEAARAERRQQMMDRYRERIDVKSDEDWKNKIEPLVSKVTDAQRAAVTGGGFGGFGRGGGGGGGGGGRGGGGAGGGAGGGPGGAPPNPEREALTKAVEDKAPADEIKDKLAKYRESRKAKEAALEKAQDDLRKALSPRQEAGAVLAGLLK